MFDATETAIINFAKGGWDINSIARHFRRTVADVQTILDANAEEERKRAAAGRLMSTADMVAEVEGLAGI